MRSALLAVLLVPAGYALGRWIGGGRLPVVLDRWDRARRCRRG